MQGRSTRLPVSGAYLLALVALVVGSVGGAYAADKLGKNDVKSKHIKNGQVKSKDIKDGAVTGDDVDEATLALDSGIRWAFVQADGTITSQSGGITLTDHSNDGVYRLDFGVDLSNMAVLATAWNGNSQIESGICGAPAAPGTPPESECPPGSNTTSNADILTEESDGTNADKAFYVVAIP